MASKKISVEQLKKQGTMKRPSFMMAVESSFKQNETYTEKQITDVLQVNEEDKKKVTRALNNLVRHKRIDRRYLNDKAFYFKGDVCSGIGDR